jgi:hypothetical protein
MHGSAYGGDAVAALTDLADAWELRFGGTSPTRRSDNPDDPNDLDDLDDLDDPTDKETGP